MSCHDMAEILQKVVLNNRQYIHELEQQNYLNIL